MKHKLDNDEPIFGTLGDITDEQERYNFFVNVENEHLYSLRQERTKRLQECDWTQMNDVSENIKDLWKNYRQDLRDITNKYTSLFDVVWPTKPEENNQ